MKKFPIDIKADGDAVTIRLTGVAARRFRAVADWRDNGLLGALHDLAPALLALERDCDDDYDRFTNAVEVARAASAGRAEVANDGTNLVNELAAFIFAADKNGAA